MTSPLDDERGVNDPLAWRPQVPAATRRPPVITDPIVEPLWSGLRVIAHFQGDESGAGSLRLLDEDGLDVTDRAHGALLRELRSAILAYDAVIDGILTVEATRGGEGTSLVGRPRVSRMGLVMPREAEMEYGPAQGQQRRGELAFVALDVLRLDGQPLLELPLLERKRLLEGLVAESELVRRSPYTRPPLAPWLASWKSAGFRGAMLKAANSRYRPGDFTMEWTVVTKQRTR